MMVLISKARTTFIILKYLQYQDYFLTLWKLSEITYPVTQIWFT